MFKPKFVGPFVVVRMVGTNACELDLPASMRVHRVFNVALCKLYTGTLARPTPIEVDGELEYEIEAILNHRRSGRGY